MMAERNFQLKVIPRADGDYGVALLQANPQGLQPGLFAKVPGGGDEVRTLVRVWGTPLQAVTDCLLETLRRCGYRATDLGPHRRAPFHLDEPHGVRLGLLLLAVKPLRKLSRLETNSRAIWNMSDEEIYYWFSKCTAHPDGRRALRALRILLSKE